MSPPTPEFGPSGSAPVARASLATAQAASESASSFDYVWGGALQRVFVLDGQRAWTAEDGSRIRCTSDAGLTWTFQDTPDESRGLLGSVFFLADGLHGWAVSDDGLVLGTDSGGAAGWTILNPVPLVDPTRPQNKATLFDVYFVDTQNGWLAGLHLLKRTSDGGQTWIDVTVQDGGGDPVDMTVLEIYALAFLQQGGQQILLASAEPGMILRSTDALGETWTVVLDISDPAVLQPVCPATGHLEIWDVAFVPGTPIASAAAYAVSGLGNGCGYVFATKDGGQSWHPEAYATGGNNQHPRAFALYGVCVFADGRAIACGYGGMILQRDATQPVWHDVSDSVALPTQPLLSVACDPNPGPNPLAWTVGSFGAIRSSQDAGRTWTEQADTQAWRLQAIDFPPAGGGATGWVAGQQYRIARTTDGGAKWVEQRAEPPGSVDFGRTLRAIAFADATNGVAVGAASSVGHLPVIYFTSLGGDAGSWTRATLPAGLAGTEFRAVHSSGVNAAARNEFWAAAASGLVLRSVDGGANWSTVPVSIVGPPLPPRWNSVWFLNLATGLFVGSWSNGRAAALRIENAKVGPPTWVDVSPGVPGEFTSVSADPVSGTAYAVGRGGAVYSLSRIDTAFRPVLAAMALVPTGVSLQTVAVVPAGAGYEVYIGGTRGFVLRLSGSTWTTPKSQSSLAVVGLSFANSSSGYAVCGLLEGLSGIVGTSG
jgi:photosystem II stability/assembly factor-like uncharacterized protein